MEWADGVSALKDALRLEAFVTKKIRDVIAVCESPKDSNNFNDYHVSALYGIYLHLINNICLQLVDYLTGDFLDEQYRGQRDLAGKISTLDKLTDSHGVIGEFCLIKNY